MIGTIALQTAVPVFATDMYTPAFPRVTTDLATTAAMVGLLVLTRTGFLVVMASQAFIFGNAGALAAMEVPTLPARPPPSRASREPSPWLSPHHWPRAAAPTPRFR